MRWTAIIPFNHGAECKTRLAAWLDASEREAMALAMAQQVVATVNTHPSFDRVILIAPSNPEFQNCDWVIDKERGLNAELQATIDALASTRIAIFHADLPCVATADLSVLIEATTSTGIAIAPDWRDEGTNALAACDPAQVRLHFGRNSFALHQQSMPDAAVVRSSGLQLDLDTIEDVERLQARGVPEALAHWLSPARYAVKPV